eukprot:6204863-Pleurochrysis_carterae.AAC.1
MRGVVDRNSQSMLLAAVVLGVVLRSGLRARCSVRNPVWTAAPYMNARPRGRQNMEVLRAPVPHGVPLIVLL